ncbi:MAG TPA: flavodoxin family protein [Thermotogota bacterium]|nr:flavodoxin family protein [Thermotogota bacterium]HPJ88853.1 flavodoxin family protein [Thermotogota bacterium]HPR97222.1 flavodoxin family protein [Thermotogota bacterium]
MKTLLVYSSKTGNTKKVAEEIIKVLPQGSEIYPVEEAPEPSQYDNVVIGYWINRGTADDKTLKYIERIEGKKVGFFCTLGAYPDSEHALNCIKNGYELLGINNEVLTSFICQGKIDPALTERFKELPPDHPHAMTPERKKRHEIASKHPDADDFRNAQEAFKSIF